MAVCFLKRSFILIIAFSFMGCTAVFDSLDRKEQLILNANCSEKAPVNLSYYCKPSVDYTPGPKSLSTYSLTPEFQLINNTCTGLSIDSTTGVISGVKAMLELSSTCSYQIQVSQGSKTEVSEIISINGSSAITYSFSEPSVAVEKGGSLQSVNIIFSESLPFKADINYEFYSTQEEVDVPFLGYDQTNSITADIGDTKIKLNFSIASSSSFNNTAFFGLTVKDLLPEPGNDFLDLRAFDTKISFDYVSTSYGHACGISSDGELYCWGSERDGKIGNGNNSSNNIYTPQRISISNTWERVELGKNHSCGINSGELYCWGKDDYGQVGNGGGSTVDVNVAEKIGSSNTWSALSLSEFHTCGIDNGELYCWGADFYGQVGNGSGSTSNIEAPQKIGSSNSWSDITVGEAFSCGIDAGELYCWGSDSSGEVGNGSGSTSNIESPQKIGSSNTWSSVGAGNSHACGINNGELYCWGSDSIGQIGNGSVSTAKVEAPQRIGNSNKWSAVAGGELHTCGINNNELYCWGYNEHGQVGNGSLIDFEIPQKISNSSSWILIEAGGYQSCAIKNNDLYCWGKNNNGQLANSNYKAIEIPLRIGTSNNWEVISSSQYHNCATNGGKAFCWGSGYSESLGNGSISNIRSIPQLINNSNKWSAVSAGYNHSCGINSGALYCWGDDVFGQVGNGSASTVDIDSPQQVGVSYEWSQISMGYYYSCGIKSGELYCWGGDNYGQVGNGSGSTSNIESPQKIGVFINWSHISTGRYHTCGINSGELYCWGRDDFGQVGNGSGSTSNIESPQKIGSSNTWSEVSIGLFHTCGINDGELYCWGRDAYGEVGNGSGSTSNIEIPQKIGSSNNWSHISVGSYHSCGINDGELYCWGSDSNGQLGNGSLSTTDIESPQKIGSSNNWKYISAGTSHTCGLQESKLFCFGSNSYGQSGFNGKTDVPTLVMK